MYTQKVDSYLEELEQNFDDIKQERKDQITEIADAINQLALKEGIANVNFICTHNSRRSQVAELWFRIAIRFFNNKTVHGYSGGTEATAFYASAVEACRKKGVGMFQKAGSIANHTYYTIYKYHKDPIRQFSKRFDDPHNPKDNIVAVMVCDHASEACPVIHGSFKRLNLNYVDPKFSDLTDQEAQVYEAKIEEISLEMMYLASLLD